MSPMVSEIDLLDKLQSAANNNRGIKCVQSIISYLRNNDIESAKMVWMTDGDKIRQYPEVKAVIIKLLGCRLHFKTNCDDWLCNE